MKLNDYKMSSNYDKRKWIESYKIMNGLPYFGGKAYIGPYLINEICNMATQMDTDGKKADMFIDVFGGGGKIALSVPEGWFDTIILNDYNYGITSYFNCCKNNPDELIDLIEKLGSVMDEDLFHLLAFIRSNDGNRILEKEYGEGERYQKYREILFDDKIEPLLSAAATFWVTKLDFMGITDPLKVSYKASIADNKEETIGRPKEKEKIENTVKFAKKHIPEICRRMRKNNIIVERLDFAELIKKYNGKPYKTIDGTELTSEENLDKNKLWYLDSPYHPSTLNNGEEAPYEDTFDIELVSKMTEIIHNDNTEVYGELDYFIKSDYDPKDSFVFAMEMIKRYTAEKEKLEAKGIIANKKEQDEEIGKESISKESVRLQTINDYLKKLEKQRTTITTAQKFCGKSLMPFHHFDCLEDNSEYIAGGIKPLEQRVYFKECLGEFTKATTNKITGEKVIGKEYIWFKGMRSHYEEKMDNGIIRAIDEVVAKNVMAESKKES